MSFSPTASDGPSRVACPGGALRIVHVIGSLREGGAEGQLVLLLGQLRARGHEQALCILRREGARLAAVEALGVPIIDLGFPLLRPPWNPAAWWRLLACLARTRRVLRAQRPDVVHGWLFEAYVWAALALRLGGGGAPLVTSRRQLGTFREGRCWMERAQAFANRRTAIVIANSEAVAADARAREGASLPPVRVVPNGLDLAALDAAPAADLRALFPALADADSITICVATLVASKGWFDLLAAWRTVTAQHPRAGLLCVGADGGARTALEQAAAGLSRVAVAGPRSDVASLLKGADLSVLPSHEEGMPNSVIEAMAARLAVVATRVGGIPELVLEGSTGLLVPPRSPAALAEALCALIGNPGRRTAMGKVGRERARLRHGLAAFADGHVEAYRAAATPSHSSRGPA
jgi:glycosyltransferase involved in cell wall biosynthesis